MCTLTFCNFFAIKKITSWKLIDGQSDNPIERIHKNLGDVGRVHIFHWHTNQVWHCHQHQNVQDTFVAKFHHIRKWPRNEAQLNHWCNQSSITRKDQKWPQRTNQRASCSKRTNQRTACGKSTNQRAVSGIRTNQRAARSKRTSRGQHAAKGPIRGQYLAIGPIRGQHSAKGPIRGQNSDS